jgi:hypothetical protein
MTRATRNVALVSGRHTRVVWSSLSPQRTRADRSAQLWPGRRVGCSQTLCPFPNALGYTDG